MLHSAEDDILSPRTIDELDENLRPPKVEPPPEPGRNSSSSNQLHEDASPVVERKRRSSVLGLDYCGDAGLLHVDSGSGAGPNDDGGASPAAS